MHPGAERRRKRISLVLERLIQRGLTPIGVDFGASGAKLMQLRKSRGVWSVVGAARVEAPQGEEDPARCARMYSEAIAARVEAAGFIGRRCVIGLDNQSVKVRSVRLPHMADNDADNALRVDGAARLGLKEVRCEIGWMRAGEVRQGDEVRDEIILVGATHEHAEHAIEAVSGAGLQPMACEPSFVACARAMGWRHRRQSDQRHVRIVIDIGAKSSGVMVLRGDSLAFYKQLDWGGARLDEAAAKRLSLDVGTAEEIRRQRMRPESDAGGPAEGVDPLVDRAIFDAVRPLLTELAQEATLCVRYYMVTFRGERPESIQLVGGNAGEPRLCDAVKDVTGIDTFVGNPFDGFNTTDATFIGGDRRGYLTQWAGAAGLCLRLEDNTRARALRAESAAPAAEAPTQHTREAA